MFLTGFNHPRAVTPSDGVAFVLFTIFVTYTLLPLDLKYAVGAGTLTSLGSYLNAVDVLIHSFNHSFIHLFVQSIVHSFIHSFIHVYIHSFLH